MENFKAVDNPQQNSAYEFGFIQAAKLTLQKLIDYTAADPDPKKSGYSILILSVLMNHCNEMPIVTDCGKYSLDTSQDPNKIVFDWKEDKRAEMLDLLNS